MATRDDRVEPAAAAIARPRLGPLLARVPIILWRLLVFVLLIALWWAAAAATGDNFLPTPLQTAAAATRVIGDGTVPRATLEQPRRVPVRLSRRRVFAIPFGLAMGGFRVFGGALEPYVDALSAMPRVAVHPADHRVPRARL